MCNAKVSTPVSAARAGANLSDIVDELAFRHAHIKETAIQKLIISELKDLGSLPGRTRWLWRQAVKSDSCLVSKTIMKAQISWANRR